MEQVLQLDTLLPISKLHIQVIDSYMLDLCIYLRTFKKLNSSFFFQDLCLNGIDTHNNFDSEAMRQCLYFDGVLFSEIPKHLREHGRSCGISI